LTARRADLSRDLERMGVERARLLADNIELDRKAAQLAEETAAASAEVARLAEQAATSRAELAALEESLKTLRIEAQAAQELRAEIEVELVKKQSDLKHLDETSRKELGSAAQEITAGQTTAGDADGAEAETVEPETLDESAVEEAEMNYQEVRAKIEALGPVNPQALEEFQEAQQRYDFLNAQRQDLLESIKDTESAIQEPSKRSMSTSAPCSKCCSAAARARCASPTRPT
jgi:chromosome segregation protein